jgi:long-chain fatty acid transport protein
MLSKILLFCIFFLIMLCSFVYPAGFMIYNQDAAAVGMGNSFTAIADNPSAVFYNPAGINQLEGTQVRSGFNLIYSDTSFRGSESGERADMQTNFAATATGYLTHKVNDKISLGGGIFIPFGLAAEWPSGWEGATVAYYSELLTYCFNPVISFQVHPRLSLAIGVDYLYADVKVRRVLDAEQLIGLPLPVNIGRISMDGFDDTWGYNLGLLLHLNDRWKLGISYRSKLNLEFDGHAHYNVAPILQPLFPPTDISPRIELPPIISTQISAQLWDKWTFAFGTTWTGWAVYDELEPKFRNDLLIPPRMKKIPQDWRDVWAFHLGTQYQYNPTWVFRGGYIFDQTPVPERTLGPMVPDADGHLFSLGIGYTKNNFTIDLASMVLLIQDRHTRRNIDGLNGKYTSTGVNFLFSTTYLF